MLTVSEAWKTTFPGAAVGTLVMRAVTNPPSHAILDQRKGELESQLREHFASGGRAALKSLPVIQAYAAHFEHFKKTYPVQLQLESVALKGKAIPRVAALVEAMFMAEIKNLLLTAGHDAALVQPPVQFDVATGSERYILINGQEQVTKPGDMMMTDTQGVISSVIYGPDQRTRITADTRRAMFVVYAPAGVGEQAVRDHLRDIQANVLLVAPEAVTDALEVYAMDRAITAA